MDTPPPYHMVSAPCYNNNDTSRDRLHQNGYHHGYESSLKWCKSFCRRIGPYIVCGVSSFLVSVLLCVMLWFFFLKQEERPEDVVKQLLVGRCIDYQRFQHPASDAVDCGHTASKLEKIFNVEGAACSPESYDDFLQYVQHPVSRNKGLLWSGMKDVVDLIALDGYRFISLRSTLPGYIMDKVSLCKSLYVTKPGCKGCSPQKASDAYWTSALKHFAKSLSGTVIVLVSATDSTAFHWSSVIAQTGIPNLSNRVSSVQVWLIKPLDFKKSAIKQRCGRGWLKSLQQGVLSTGRLFKCKADEKLPTYAMCLREPQHCPLVLPSEIRIPTTLPSKVTPRPRKVIPTSGRPRTADSLSLLSFSVPFFAMKLTSWLC